MYYENRKFWPTNFSKQINLNPPFNMTYVSKVGPDHETSKLSGSKINLPDTVLSLNYLFFFGDPRSSVCRLLNPLF